MSVRVLLTSMSVLAGLAGCGSDDKPVVSSGSQGTDSEAGEATSASLPRPGSTVSSDLPDIGSSLNASELASGSARPSGTEKIIVGPNLGVFGAQIGADADAAVDAVRSHFGSPTLDTGWNVGCPLDGDEENERTVAWGSLHLNLVRSDGVERLDSWGYSTDAAGVAEPDGVQPDLLDLPGDAEFGLPMSLASNFLGSPVVYDDLFGVTQVYVDGLEILGEGVDASGVLTQIGVPFVPKCE